MSLLNVRRANIADNILLDRAELMYESVLERDHWLKPAETIYAATLNWKFFPNLRGPLIWPLSIQASDDD